MSVLPDQLSLDLESPLVAAPTPESAEHPEPRPPTPRAARTVSLAAVASVEKLLTVAEVGQLTGLSLNAVYRAIWSGELQASKLRGRIRVAAHAVEAWIDASRVPTKRTEHIRAGAGSRRPRPANPGRGLRELLEAAAPPA